MPAPVNPNALDNLTFYKLADMIANENMNPNVITMLNIIPSALSLYFLYTNDIIPFIIFTEIRLFLDCLDGFVARKYNKTSKFGAILDQSIDLIYIFVLVLILLRNQETKVIGLIIAFVILIMYSIVTKEIDTEFQDDCGFLNDLTILSPLLILLIQYILK